MQYMLIYKPQKTVYQVVSSIAQLFYNGQRTKGQCGFNVMFLVTKQFPFLEILYLSFLLMLK